MEETKLPESAATLDEANQTAEEVDNADWHFKGAMPWPAKRWMITLVYLWDVVNRPGFGLHKLSV